MHKNMSQFETTVAARRVVLLGASNLARCFPIVMCIAKQLLDSPLEIVVAMGHGRSYGQETTFFRKKFCGILQSNLWEHLEQNNHVPTYALITDVGNDILYGVSVETISQWVAESTDRLQNRGARVMMTDLPVSSICHLGKVRFQLLRALFFPACRLPLETIVARAEVLSRALQKMAENKKIPIIKAKIEWYGLDPIHIRRSKAASAWAEILGQWPDLSGTLDCHQSTSCLAYYVHSIRQVVSSLGWSSQQANQPIRCMLDGTTLAQF